MFHNSLRRSLPVWLLLLLVVPAAAGQRTKVVITSSLDGAEQPCYVVLPDEHDEAKPAPLLVSLHSWSADLEQRNWRGEHLVHIAVNTRNMELLAYLVEQKGAEVNVTRHHGKTPLHDAVNRRQADFTAFLIEHGADVDAVDEWGWSPLHLASARGDADSVQLLLDAGADIDARTTDAQRLRGEEVPEGATAEDVAAIHGQNKILECLGAA